jgi:hypothetical protein
MGLEGGDLLWQTDGTAQGTKAVSGISYPIDFNNLPTSLVGTSDGNLYFSPPDPIFGNELWKVIPDVATSELTIRGTAGDDAITVSVGTNGILRAVVNGTETDYSAAQYSGGITIDSGGADAAGDSLTILSLPDVSTSVISAGLLKATVGSNARGLADISATSLTLGGSTGTLQLTVNDSADSTARHLTLDTATDFGVAYDELLGLIPGDIRVAALQLVVNLGNAGNRLDVNGTAPAPQRLPTWAVINLNTGNGNDTVNVSAAGAGTVLNINGQAGQDAVNIGDTGVDSVGLRNINGAVNVNNPLGQTAITLDAGFQGGSNVTLDTFDASGVTWGTLQGIAPGVINFSSVGLGSLSVTAGVNGTSLTVKNTPGGGPLEFNGIALVEVMGVAAGQSLSVPSGVPDVVVANIDLFTGRIAGGVFVNADVLDVRGAAGQTYHGLGAAYNEDSLVDINVSGGTYVLPDLDLTFGHSGITFDGADTHAVFPQTEHLEPLGLRSGATATLAPGSDLFCRGLILDGKLDIGVNQVVDPFDSVQQIHDWIKSGLAGGNGITSSAVDATHTIGFSSAGLIKWTLYGDVNLDGKVDFNDLLTLAQNYGRANASWYQGDFNYDGKVDFADLLKLGQNLGQTLPTLAAASAGVHRPQPLDLVALKRRRAHR